MDSIKLTAIAIVVIATVAGGWILLINQPEPSLPNQQLPAPSTTKTDKTANKPQTQIPPAVETTSPKDNQQPAIEENTSIDDDLIEIDAQLKGLEEDSATIDESLNDTSEILITE